MDAFFCICNIMRRFQLGTEHQHLLSRPCERTWALADHDEAAVPVCSHFCTEFRSWVLRARVYEYLREPIEWAYRFAQRATRRIVGYFTRTWIDLGLGADIILRYILQVGCNNVRIIHRHLRSTRYLMTDGVPWTLDGRSPVCLWGEGVGLVLEQSFCLCVL